MKLGDSSDLLIQITVEGVVLLSCLQILTLKFVDELLPLGELVFKDQVAFFYSSEADLELVDCLFVVHDVRFELNLGV